MAQISIISKSDIIEANRIDAEYYKPFNLKSEKLITSKSFFRLKDIGEFVIGPFGSTVKVEDYVPEKKYRYIRGKDIKNGVLKNDDNVAVSKEKFDSLPKYHLKDQDLLITVVGTLGNVAIYRNSFGPAIFSCKSTVLRPTQLDSEFIMIFLSTKYGRSLLMRNERGAIQKGFNLPDLENIPIPDFSKTLKESILHYVKEAHRKQIESKELYEDAKQILLKELGVEIYQPKNSLFFETTNKIIKEVNRFDAEYFQPKYAEIIKHIEKYSNGYDTAKNIVSWKKGTEVGSKAYTKQGRDFVRVSDFSIYGAEEAAKKISNELYLNLKEEFSPKKGDILFTKDGTIGITSVLKSNIEGILSGAFLILTLKKKYKSFEKECLALIFNSIILKMQVEQLSGGALIAHLKPSDFEKLKVPIIKPEVQQKIARKIRKSFQLRENSKELLDTAIRKVEEEIEKE